MIVHRDHTVGKQSQISVSPNHSIRFINSGAQPAAAALKLTLRSARQCHFRVSNRELDEATNSDSSTVKMLMSQRPAAVWHHPLLLLTHPH